MADCCCKDLRLPDFRDYAIAVPHPGGVKAEATRVMGVFLRDVMKLQCRRQQFPRFRSGRDQFQSARARYSK